MNARAESIAALTAAPRAVRITDNHVFIFVASLFLVLTLAGFVPSSLAKIEAVQSGGRAPFPAVLHAHAALMGGWLLLLLSQTVLAATGRRAAHRVLGLIGAGTLVAILATGAELIRVTWQGLWGPGAAEAMPPAVLVETRHFVTNLLLLQAWALGAFVAFVAWGLVLRRRDPQAHRRLMLLGTAVPMLAGVDRLTMSLGWTTLPDSPLALHLYLLVIVLPLLAWDLWRHRQVHHTTRVWVGVNLVLALAINLLWNSDWWQATAPRLMGVA